MRGVVIVLARSVWGQAVKSAKSRSRVNAGPFSTREIAVVGWCGCLQTKEERW